VQPVLSQLITHWCYSHVGRNGNRHWEQTSTARDGPEALLPNHSVSRSQYSRCSLWRKSMRNCPEQACKIAVRSRIWPELFAGRPWLDSSVPRRTTPCAKEVVVVIPRGDSQALTEAVTRVPCDDPVCEQLCLWNRMSSQKSLSWATISDQLPHSLRGQDRVAWH